jgi:predicted nucleotide-binding protein
MSLTDLLGQSQLPHTTTGEKTILETIESCLNKMKIILMDGRFHQGHLLILKSTLYSQMSKIYGKDSVISKYFKPTNEKFSPAATAETASVLIDQTETFVRLIRNIETLSFAERRPGKVFIGHGGSPLWRELKDFLSDRLGLAWDEFNREPVAGVTTFERISQMLFEAEFAFLVLTAEDIHLDKSLHARENVVHEVGLFQGRLGPRKAIILLEEGCEEFSNIIGLSQIRFPKGHIYATFEEIRRVLEREEVLKI